MTNFTIVLSHELAALRMDRGLRQQFARGEMHRVVRGAYIRTAEFTALDSDARYRARVAAVSRLLPDTQFSGDSAAALWRLPCLGKWPDLVHAASPRQSGGRSGALVQRHGIGLDPNATQIDGITLTSLARTLAEIACGPSFARAVGMLDDGLRQPVPGEFRSGRTAPTREQVIGELESLGRIAGRARAARAIDFADPASGSLGETVSRVQMLALGIPLPEIQVPFYDRLGLIGITDFYWRELGLIGEFDGHSKYGDRRRFDTHLTAEEVLVAEKEREDRLRAVAGGIVRWGWRVAMNRPELGALLEARGLRGRRRGGFDRKRA
ncbi:MAG: hypothetical protein KF761_05260 [Salinibacterium sp.]|nr:hypothetical protein [Salinibacterium sp.]